MPPGSQFIQNERQWLLINCGVQKCAFLHVYIACGSQTDTSFLHWNDTLFRLLTHEALSLKRQGFTNVSLGDFNSRIGVIPGLDFNNSPRHRNAPMFLQFVSEVNLLILNTPHCLVVGKASPSLLRYCELLEFYIIRLHLRNIYCCKLFAA